MAKGKKYRKWYEKHIHVQDKVEPSKHKPVPFAIGCRSCQKSYCNHVLWGIGDSDEYERLPEGESYFKNDPNVDCGVAVCNKSYRNLDEWRRDHTLRKFLGLRGGN